MVAGSLWSAHYMWSSNNLLPSSSVLVAYQKISDSGIHMRAPFGIDKIAARVQLRVLQSEISGWNKNSG